MIKSGGLAKLGSRRFNFLNYDKGNLENVDLNNIFNEYINKENKNQFNKENIEKTSIYYEKQVTAEYSLMILNLISIFLAYSLFDNLHSKLENEVTYNCKDTGFISIDRCSFDLDINGNAIIKEESELSLNIILISSSVLSFFMIILNIFYSNYKMKYLKYKGKISYSKNIFSSNEYRLLIFNILISIIHPNYLMKYYSFNNINSVSNIKYRLFINDILCLFMLIRVIPFIILIISNINYNSLKAERICEINGFKKDLFFGVKCLMKLNPFKLIFISFLIIIFIFSFGIRVCEYSYSKQIEIVEIQKMKENEKGFENNKGNPRFTSYFICIWWVIITMTTVGYGDYYPETIYGKIFALIVCILGIFIISTSVIAIHNTINLSNRENNVK